MSASRATRLAITMLNWVVKEPLRPFDAEGVQGAFDYLGVPEADRAKFLALRSEWIGMQRLLKRYRLPRARIRPMPLPAANP
jgi:hypothetical protein